MCNGEDLGSRKPICAHCGSRRVVQLSRKKADSKVIETYKCRACAESFLLMKNLDKELVNFAEDLNDLFLRQGKTHEKEPKKCTQVWPAYNEAKVIKNVIKGLKKEGYDDLIVVDDGSKDDTSHIAKAAGATVYNHIISFVSFLISFGSCWPSESKVTMMSASSIRAALIPVPRLPPSPLFIMWL